MRAKQNKKTSDIHEQDKVLGRRIVDTLCQQFLAEGLVKTRGKTEAQIWEELRSLTLKWSKQRPMLLAIDHRVGLLEKARSHVSAESYYEAFLFYATWFEHWINGILSRRLTRLDETARRQMLRETSLKGKYTWLIALVHGATIPKRYLDAILKVGEIRNSFVHYKFVPNDIDQWRNEKSALAAAHKNAERAIKFLVQKETQLFFDNKARRLVSRFK